jgi:hypothetical protein
MTEAAEIAAKLTEAQREAVLAGYPIPSMGTNGYDTFMLPFEYGRSAKALHRLGLAALPFAPQMLTPLGLAVRAVLQEKG